MVSTTTVRALLLACAAVVAVDLVVVADRRGTGERAAASEPAGLPFADGAPPIVDAALLEARLLDLSVRGFELAPAETSQGLTGPLDRAGAAALDPATAAEVERLLGDLGFVAGHTRFWLGPDWDVLNFVWSFADADAAARYVALARHDYEADGEVEVVDVPGVPGAVGYRATAPHPGSEVVFAAGREVYAVVVVGAAVPGHEVVTSLVAAQFARSAAG